MIAVREETDGRESRIVPVLLQPNVSTKAQKGGKVKKGGGKGDKKGKSKGICSTFNGPKGCYDKKCNKAHLCSFKNADGSFCNSNRHGKARHVVE